MASGDAGPGGPHPEAGRQLRRPQDPLAARDALAAGLEARAAPSLVDALLAQVARLRGQLRRQEGGAEARLRQEVERLTECLQEKEEQMRELMGRPQLALPWRSVAEERARAASDVLCRSLAEETHQLRRTLAATAHMCQHLARRLDEQPARRGAREESADEAGRPHTGSDTSDQAIIQKLQAENLLLKRKVTHVEDLNSRWQRYDASRDEYVRGLHLQLRGLQAAREPGLAQEIARLNRQLEEKMEDCALARQELAAAGAARDAALERVQMLEQQILAYKDDFTSERADRERAQSRIQELEGKVASLLYRVSQGQDSCEPDPRWTHTEGRTARRVEAGALARVEPRGQRPGSRTQRLEPAAEDGGRGPARSGEGDLQCPLCLRCFGDEQGDDLLRHVAECCQ